MDEGFYFLVGVSLFAILVFIASVYAIRAIFMLPTIVDQLQRQTDLLKDIAVTQRMLLERRDNDNNKMN